MPLDLIDRNNLIFSIVHLEGDNGTLTHPDDLPPHSIAFEIQKLQAVELIRILSSQLVLLEEKSSNPSPD